MLIEWNEREMVLERVAGKSEIIRAIYDYGVLWQY